MDVVQNQLLNRIWIHMTPKRLLVAGGGVSGLAAAELGIMRGYQVTISNQTTLAQETRRELIDKGVLVFDSGHDTIHLKNVDLVVVSPGIPDRHLICVEARKQNIPILSEIDFALQDYRGKIIAVTGTNGKSTTVCMVGQILRRSAVAVTVGGNLGEPPSAMAVRGSFGDFLVLELSSYQLEQSQPHATECAGFTSFSPDHLERHGTLESYMAAKWRIFDWVRPGGLCILTSDVDVVAKSFKMPRRTDVHWKIIPGITSDHPSPEFIPPEICTSRHNAINADMAILLASAVLPQLPVGVLGQQLSDFNSLPFRCERVGSIGGKPVINDSKSTNCESTCAALAGPGPQVVLLMGGKGKGESYLPILQFTKKIGAIVCFGESGQSIANELFSKLAPEGITVIRHESLADAVIEGVEICSKLNCGLLFSPGCASFDEFKNFEDRGQFFNAAVSRYLDNPA